MRKTSPDIIRIALGRVNAGAKTNVMIGYTAFDDEAAHHACIASVGVLTGHIAEHILREAGCEAVFPDVTALRL